MTFAITADRKNGKFYFARDKQVGWRLCVFYVAFDFFYDSLDSILRKLTDKIDTLARKAGVEV